MVHPDPKKMMESSKLVAIGVLESVFALGYLLAKQTGRAKRKLITAGRHGWASSLNAKNLLRLPSSCRRPPPRATRRNHNNNNNNNNAPAAFDRFDDHDDPFSLFDDESDHNRCYAAEGELWQRSILMGDKCQPLDFSGVIYYDCDGNRVSQLPTTKSPHATSTSSSPFAPPPGAGYMK